VKKTQRIGLLGGSFNPVHIGHLRLALEVREVLGLDRVDLLPVYNPPHKSAERQLRFFSRVAMLEAAVREIPGLRVSTMESEVEGASFSFNTLHRLQGRMEEIPYFILGCNDLLCLPDWYRGVELPSRCHLVVADRSGLGMDRAVAFARDTWPGCEAVSDTAWRLPFGTEIHFVSLLRLDISSSLIRNLWLAGRSIRYLVPDPVFQWMKDNAQEVREAWEQV
jgi:nicotinate-nucleotide adenylyltransferase